MINVFSSRLDHPISPRTRIPSPPRPSHHRASARSSSASSMPIMPLPLHINTNTGDHHHHHIQQAPPPSFTLSSSSPDQISSGGIQHSAASYPPSVPWPSRDDNLLVAARLQGHGWGQIQKEHFPSKTPNACRKRYERLIAKRRGSDWDSERFERLGTRYRELREQTWKPLADAVGEKWQDVEKVVSLLILFCSFLRLFLF